MISRAFNPKTRLLTRLFPKWSAAYADPNSNTNKLLNPYANVFEYLENIIQDIHDDAVLSRVDIDRHPFERWLVDYNDISGPGLDTKELKNEAITTISNIIGTISTTDIPLIEADSDGTFFNPELETAWYIGGSFLHGIVDPTLQSCEFINNRLHILVSKYNNEGTILSDPGYVFNFSLPNRWSPNTTLNENFTLNETVEDPAYETITKQVTITKSNTRILLDHQLSFRNDKVSILDVTGSVDDNVYITNFEFTNTFDYTVADVYVADIDGDGIIDQKEIDLITPELGKSKANYTEEEWNETYSNYDINGDGLIDDGDLAAIQALQNTVQLDVSAVVIPDPGTYEITYEIPLNGQASTAVYKIDNVPVYFKNTIYNYLRSPWPNGFIDASYDDHKKITYYLDNDSKSIWAYENTELITSQTLDRYKIQLPISASLELKGIIYHNYRIYVLAFRSGNPYIYTVRTDVNEIEDNITFVPIHSGARNIDDQHIKLRDNTGLDSSATGLTIINGSKLATVTNTEVVILLPIYDYYYFSVDNNNNNRVSFREKYESLASTPELTLYPIYQNLWNMIDTHAEEKGLYRLPGENNEGLKNRSLDVFPYFPSRDRTGSLYGMQRELGSEVETLHEVTHIKILPSFISKDNANTLRIFDDNVEVLYDNISITNEYRYGKYTHDKITYTSAGTEIVSIDKDVIQ
jgi:hypothetical protein